MQKDVPRKGVKRPKKAYQATTKNGHKEGHISDASSGSESPKRKISKGSPNKEKHDHPMTSCGSKDETSVEQNVSGKDAFYDEPEMPPSPISIRENIKQKFLFEMPEDFYSFWEFCQSLNGANPACKV